MRGNRGAVVLYLPKKAALGLKRALAGRPRREGFTAEVKRWVVEKKADGSGAEEVAAAAREVFGKRHRGSPVTATEVRRWWAVGDVATKYAVGARGGVGKVCLDIACRRELCVAAQRVLRPF